MKSERRITVKHAPALLSVILLATCCSGGGGDDETFAGVWYGTASLVDDDCPGGPMEFGIYFTHLVNQDGDSIVLDNGAMAFSGTASDRSFSAASERSAREPRPFAGTCKERIEWRYNEIDRGVASFVVRRSTITCDDNGTAGSCTRSFSGNAFESTSSGGGGVGRPIPVDAGEGAVSDAEL